MAHIGIAMFRTFALLASICWVCGPAYADASTFCIYSLLTETHVMTSHCGNSLNAGGELRYQKLLAAIRANLIENTHQAGKSKADVKAFLDGNEIKLNEHYQGKNDAVCKSPDYQVYRDMLVRLTSQKSVASILDGLKSSKDPYAGDCL